MLEPSERKVLTWAETFRTLRWFYADRARRYIGLFALVAIASAFNQLPIKAVELIAEAYSRDPSSATVTRLSWYFAGFSVVGVVLMFVRTWARGHLVDERTKASQNRVRDLYQLVLSFPYHWHLAQRSGSRSTEIAQGIRATTELSTVVQRGVLQSITALVMNVAFLVSTSPKTALVALGVLAGHLAIESSFRDRILDRIKEARGNSVARGGVLTELNHSAAFMKLMGVQSGILRFLNEKLSAEERAFSARNWLLNKKFMLSNNMRIISAAIVVPLLLIDTLGGSLSAVGLTAAYLYFQRAIDAAEELVLLEQDVTQYRSDMQPLGKYITPEFAPEATGAWPANWQAVTVQNLSYHYPESDHPVLNDVSFGISRGEKVGICGASGSGKSTLGKLLLGVVEPTAGSVAIGETPPHAIASEVRGNHFAIVPQENEIFHASLSENIALFRDADSERIMQAAATAQLGPVIDRLPNGVATIVGEKGLRLSGGERQRVGIARALYLEPEILLLDEATSALDSHTEAAVQEAVESALPGQTLVVVAHRLSTLKNLDRIYVFDHGEIVEVGTFRDLIKQNGHFAALWERQQHEAKV